MLKPRFFYLSEHTYPGLNYRTMLQTKEELWSSLHTHDYYEFLLITSGDIEHFINGKTMVAGKGELYLIRPSDVHQLAIMRKGGEYMNLNFSSELMDSLLHFWGNEALNREINDSEFPPVRMLDDTNLEYARDKMLQTMFKEHVSFEEQTYVMKKRLFDIFAAFFVKKSHEEKENIPQWLIKTVEQMEKKENFSIGISRMVELSEKSIEHLSRSMRKYYGCSPTEHINALRIDYMSSMLAYSTLPIIDIWMDVGFESAGYAYKLFKQRYGVTPQQYRKHTN